MIETENVGILASALEGMEYEDAKDYADVLAWDGPDPKPVDKRKRVISDGESSDCEEEDYSDNDSGNNFRHEVPSLRVAAAKGAARFKTKNYGQSLIAQK
jgi:hypothetical protein